MSMKNIKEIKTITWIGMLINLGLAGIKFFVGILGSSQAVIADAVHSLSDIATDLAIVFGVKFWSAPPDADHPYGHRKIELLITACTGIALASVAIGLGYEAIATVRDAHIIQTKWIAIWGPLLSIFLKEFLYQWTVKVGKQAKSSAVIANAWHHRSDALSSIPALIAVGLASLNPLLAFVDHIGAIIISVFILKVSWEIIKPALFELTDYGIKSEEIDMIKNTTLDVEGVEDVHAIRTRKISSSIYVDMHILVKPEMSVRNGHEISEKVKYTLLNNDYNIIDVIVHIEPCE